MEDLINCLYGFVLENRLGKLVDGPEYQACLDAVVRQEDRVRAGMDAEQRRGLNLLLREVSSLNAMENEGIFRAALGLAGELNGLAGS